MSKKLVFIVSGFVFLALVSGSLLWFLRSRTEAAKVGSISISKSDLESAILKYKKIFEYNQDQASLQNIRDIVLNILIENEIVRQKAKELGLSVSDKELNERYLELVSHYKSEEQFKRAIKEAFGLTVQEKKAEIVLNILKEKLKQFVLNERKGRFIIVQFSFGGSPPGAGEDYKSKHETNAKVWIEKINNLVKERGFDYVYPIVSKIMSERVFSSEVKQWEIYDNVITASGFSWSPVQGFVPKKDLNLVFSMKRDEVSDVIKSEQGGYYAIYTIDKIGKGQYNTWEEFIAAYKKENVKKLVQAGFKNSLIGFSKKLTDFFGIQQVSAATDLCSSCTECTGASISVSTPGLSGVSISASVSVPPGQIMCEGSTSTEKKGWCGFASVSCVTGNNGPGTTCTLGGVNGINCRLNCAVGGGKATVTASKTGYDTQSKSVDITNGSDTPVTFDMKPSASASCSDCSGHYDSGALACSNTCSNNQDCTTTKDACGSIADCYKATCSTPAVKYTRYVCDPPGTCTETQTTNQYLGFDTSAGCSNACKADKPVTCSATCNAYDTGQKACDTKCPGDSGCVGQSGLCGTKTCYVPVCSSTPTPPAKTCGDVKGYYSTESDACLYQCSTSVGSNCTTSPVTYEGLSCYTATCINKKYSCNASNLCAEDVNGSYTESTCGGSCTPAPTYRRYSCSNRNQPNWSCGLVDTTNPDLGYSSYDNCKLACKPSPPATNYTLTVSKTGTGVGTVISNDGQIICGSACSTKYPNGLNTNLQANAPAGSKFDGWISYYNKTNTVDNWNAWGTYYPRASCDTGYGQECGNQFQVSGADTANTLYDYYGGKWEYQGDVSTSIFHSKLLCDKDSTKADCPNPYYSDQLVLGFAPFHLYDEVGFGIYQYDNRNVDWHLGINTARLSCDISDQTIDCPNIYSQGWTLFGTPLYDKYFDRVDSGYYCLVPGWVCTSWGPWYWPFCTGGYWSSAKGQCAVGWDYSNNVYKYREYLNTDHDRDFKRTEAPYSNIFTKQGDCYGNDPTCAFVMNSDKTVTAQFSAVPVPSVIVSSPPQVTLPNSIPISWTVSNFKLCTASSDWSGSKLASGGSESVSKGIGTYTFKLTCYENSDGSGLRLSASSVTQVVQPPPPPPQYPQCTFAANPTQVSWPNKSTLSWNCQNATNGCQIDQGIGSVGTSGTKQVQPSGNVTYTLTCGNADGNKSYPVTINVGGSTQPWWHEIPPVFLKPGSPFANLGEAFLNFLAKLDPR